MFSKVKGQEEQRRPETYIDQHGREYFATVDMKTGDPCTTLQPMFKAPTNPTWFRKMLVPPVDDAKVVKLVPRLQRARKGYQVFIDYDAWDSILSEREEEWNARLHDLAKGMSGGMEVLRIVENPPPALLHYIGPRPFPPRVLVQAMKAGNKWALGLDDKVPAKVVALLDELESSMTRKRRVVSLGNAVADPLADDDETETLDPFENAAVDLDPFGDLEEVADPKATGGKTEPVKPKKKPKTARPLTPAA